MTGRLWASGVLLVVGAEHLLLLLFGLLAALVLAAALRPIGQGLALVAAWISALGFVLLAPR